MRSDDYLDDDVDERDRRSASAIFASGWFRAVLILGVLAITLVVAVPYALRWMEPGPPRSPRQAARPVDVRPPTEPTAPAPAMAPTPIPAPVAPVAVPPTTSTPVPLPSAVSSSASSGVVPAPSRPSSVSPAPTAAPVTRAAPPTMAAAPPIERIVPAPTPPAPARESAPARASAAADTDGRNTETSKGAARPAPAPASAPAKVVSAPAPRPGDFWVQVGAFQHERNAEALVRSIRDGMRMPAQLTRRVHAQAVAATAPRHEVFVVDAPVGAVNAALKGQGRAQAVRGGVAVRPPLDLKEAVTLSRRLSGEGLSVKIRRVGGDGTAAEPPTTYVVRVGGYATRAQAEAARRELARKGVNGFVADTPAR